MFPKGCERACERSNLVGWGLTPALKTPSKGLYTVATCEGAPGCCLGLVLEVGDGVLKVLHGRHPVFCRQVDAYDVDPPGTLLQVVALEVLLSGQHQPLLLGPGNRLHG